MRPFDKRVLDVNKKFLPNDFEELVALTASTILKRNKALGKVFKMPELKKGKFKKLK